MHVRDQLELLRRRWLSAGVTFLVVCCLGLGYTALQQPTYSASTQLFVSVEGATSAQDLNQAGIYTQQIVKSYAQLATTPAVLTPVRERLSTPISQKDLASAVSADAPIDTVILKITVRLPTAKDAAQAANAVGQQLSDVVKTLTPARSGKDPVKITTVEAASVPLSPSEPSIPTNLLITLVAALVLAIAVAHVRELLDTRLQGEADVREVSGHPVLGGVEYDSEAKATPLVSARTSSARAADAFRSLRTHLEYLDYGKAPRQVVVTSAMSREGTSTVVANLGLSFADAGKRVLLIDGDLRKPTLAEMFNVYGADGLSDVLAGRLDWRDAVTKASENGLDLLPAGTVPSNPTELLQSHALESLMEELSANYDVVLIDGPPLLSVVDSGIIAKRTAGAVVLAAVGTTTRSQLKEALSALQSIDAHVLGVVTTGTSRRSGRFR